MLSQEEEKANREAIAFVGEALAPWFLYDPKLQEENLISLMDSFASLDLKAASLDWPFADSLCAEECLSVMQQRIKEGKDSLFEEYRRLFVGPAKKVAPPWGSVYTDPDQVLFGASTIEFKLFLVRNGIEVSVSPTEPVDHFGVMLQLMAWIARNKEELLDEYLSKHFLTWATHFLELVERDAQDAFYVSCARLCGECLRGIQVSRELNIVYPRFYR